MKYVGIDYHDKVLAICIENSNGKVQEEFKTTADHKGIDLLLEKLAGQRFKVMGEASTYSINLHEYLLSKGADSVLVNPHHILLITKSDKKTDRHDAEVLASYLRLMDKNEISLSVSYIVTDEERELRDLCRYREFAGEQKGECVQRIKSHMRLHDQELEGGYDDFSTLKGQTMLRQTFGDDFILMSLLDDYLYWNNRSEAIDRMLGEDRFQTREVELLSSIPGIGNLTAVQLMSMIVDIGRFETADQMRSFFGMNPRVKDSGKTVNHGHITKHGDPMMRSILGRVLNQFLVRKGDNWLMRYYNSHVGHMGKKKVRMACMNKLLDLIFAILKRGTPYISR